MFAVSAKGVIMADEKPTSGPDPEAVAAWEVPAPTANKVYLYFDGNTVRIVFAEQGAPDLPSFVRTAVAVNVQTAIEFAKLLRNFLGPAEDALEKAKQAAAERQDVKPAS